MSRKGSSINKTRGVLYQLARFLGDFSAVSSGSPGKIARRIGRRAVGRAVGRGMRKLFR
ncbi:MAG TPA: hypothetical protein VLK32_07940 [Bacillota bacterium]|nr:hypothetical protein [Bacillota bacterium]